MVDKDCKDSGSHCDSRIQYSSLVLRMLESCDSSVSGELRYTKPLTVSPIQIMFRMVSGKLNCVYINPFNGRETMSYASTCAISPEFSTLFALSRAPP